MRTGENVQLSMPVCMTGLKLRLGMHTSFYPKICDIKPRQFSSLFWGWLNNPDLEKLPKSLLNQAFIMVHLKQLF